LAVEFNHDVELEKRSARPAFLIARVLGDLGHLSNEQAAEFVRAVLARSSPGRLRHLVQFHLSEGCNNRSLARRAARAVLADLPAAVRLHTARQDRPGKPVLLGLDPAPRRAPRIRDSSRALSAPPWLPGLAPNE